MKSAGAGNSLHERLPLHVGPHGETIGGDQARKVVIKLIRAGWASAAVLNCCLKHGPGWYWDDMCSYAAPTIRKAQIAEQNSSTRDFPHGISLRNFPAVVMLNSVNMYSVSVSFSFLEGFRSHRTFSHSNLRVAVRRFHFSGLCFLHVNQVKICWLNGIEFRTNVLPIKMLTRFDC